MDTSSTIAVFGPLMPLIVEGLKLLFPDVSGRHLAIGVSALISIAAGIALLVMGKDTYESVLATMGAIGGFVFGIGTALYRLQADPKKRA